MSLLLTLAVIWAIAPGQAAEPSRPELDQAIRLAIDARYEEALAIFKVVYSDDPEDPLLCYFVGITEYKMGRLTAAKAFLADSVARQAPFPQAYFWLARVLLDREESEDARRVLDQGLARFPRNEDLLLLAEEPR